MGFEIKHSELKRESFGAYRYNIFDDGHLVARYWHDHRGDDHGIEFLNGTIDEWPVGRMVEFITGGGPQPLGLSDRAVAYLNKKLGRQIYNVQPNPAFERDSPEAGEPLNLTLGHSGYGVVKVTEGQGYRQPESVIR